MKWFGVDSDTPNDPKIRALMLQGGPDRSSLAARARMGGLFLVWCYIADHGAQPGRGLDNDGRPLPLQEIADAAYFESVDELRAMLDFCASRNHIEAEAWTNHGVIAIPAMVRRADEYTKRLIKKQQSKPPTKSPDKTPVSRDHREKGGESPDSPICTVDPVGVVPPPVDHIGSSGTSDARASAKTGSGVMAGSLQRDHLRHVGPCGRVCVPEVLHGAFIRQLGGDQDAADRELRAFYPRVLAAIPDDQRIGDEPFTFWRKHFAATYPSAAPAVRGVRGPRHTDVSPDQFEGVTLGLTDGE